MRHLPKVTVVGLLANQQLAIQNKLYKRAVFNFVDKNRKSSFSVPSGQDIIIVAASFVSHALFNSIKKTIPNRTKLVLHYGGIELLVRKLDCLLKELGF
jgi:hypothetical protein